MAAGIHVALAAERPDLLAMLEFYCVKDASMSIAAKSRTLKSPWSEYVNKDIDVFVIWVESAHEDAISLFRGILANTNAGVVMVSNNTMLIVEAITYGVNEFLTYSVACDDEMRKKTAMKVPDIIKKMSVRPGRLAARAVPQQAKTNALKTGFKGVIALGASAGGTEATSILLRELPENIPGMVIVQHIPPVFSKQYAERLNRECAMNVREAKDWDAIEQGTVLVAPGDYQMTVVRKGTGYVVRVQKGNRVSGHCPSVDVLFGSVATSVGANAIGIILTGMGEDGARGMLQMRQAGAYTFGQDEASSMVYGMPRVAYEMGGVVKQGSIQMLPKLLLQHLSTR